MGYGPYESGSAESLGAFRQWTEENNCVPKQIVRDQAFLIDPFMAYYTLWPNRAETAVRLFKRTWSIIVEILLMATSRAGLRAYAVDARPMLPRTKL